MEGSPFNQTTITPNQVNRPELNEAARESEKGLLGFGKVLRPGFTSVSRLLGAAAFAAAAMAPQKDANAGQFGDVLRAVTVVAAAGQPNNPNVQAAVNILRQVQAAEQQAQLLRPTSFSENTKVSNQIFNAMGGSAFLDPDNHTLNWAFPNNIGSRPGQGVLFQSTPNFKLSSVDIKQMFIDTANGKGIFQVTAVFTTPQNGSFQDVKTLHVDRSIGWVGTTPPPGR